MVQVRLCAGDLIALLIIFSFHKSYGCWRWSTKPEVHGVGPDVDESEPEVTDSSAPSAALSRISVRDNWLVDTAGRVRVFHGSNAVLKEFPWYDATLLNATRMRMYKEWGFNVVRAGTMWSGAQPQEGAFNQTYIDILMKSFQNMANYGVYTLMDMHQDCLSSKLSTYNGIPTWLQDKFPTPPHAYPWPMGPNATFLYWGNCYLAQATGRAFHNIYTNVAGAKDYLGSFWKKIASVFRDTSSVIGYELINEPWPGDIYEDPSLLLPGVAGHKNLQPLYNYLNGIIRSVDPHTLIFYEPVTWGMIFNGKLSGSGFDSVPGGAEFRNRSVLSFHYYCWLVTQDDQHKRYSIFKRAACDALLGPEVFKAVQTDISVTGGSSFLTEFGACAPDGHPNSTGNIECEYTLAEAERHHQSWTYWDTTFFDAQGNVQWDVLGPFVRVYARAVAGIPQSSRFDPVSLRFDLTYTPDSKISEPTEIFVPKMKFPRGFQVVVSPGLQWTFDPTERTVLVTIKKNIFHGTETAKVSITPKERHSNEMPQLM